MATACYVAGYVQKKVGDPDTFNMMSTQPGIGSRWLAKYVDDVARLGRVVVEGKEHPVPRRYFLWALDEFEHIKLDKQKYAMEKGERLLDKFGVVGADKESAREREAKRVHMQQKLDEKSYKEKI